MSIINPFHVKSFLSANTPASNNSHLCCKKTTQTDNVVLCPPLLQQSVNDSCLLGPQQQTYSTGVQWLHGTDRWTDGQTDAQTICTQSAPRSRQITTPTPHHSMFIGRMLFLTPNQHSQSTEGTDTNREIVQLTLNMQYSNKSVLFSWRSQLACLLELWKRCQEITSLKLRWKVVDFYQMSKFYIIDTTTTSQRQMYNILAVKSKLAHCKLSPLIIMHPCKWPFTNAPLMSRPTQTRTCWVHK